MNFCCSLSVLYNVKSCVCFDDSDDKTQNSIYDVFLCLFVFLNFFSLILYIFKGHRSTMRKRERGKMVATILCWRSWVHKRVIKWQGKREKESVEANENDKIKKRSDNALNDGHGMNDNCVLSGDEESKRGREREREGRNHKHKYNRRCRKVWQSRNEMMFQ